MKFLMFLAAGLYMAHRMEKRLELQKYSKKMRELCESTDNQVDETLDESFPASDPPNFSPAGYHH